MTKRTRFLLCAAAACAFCFTAKATITNMTWDTSTSAGISWQYYDLLNNSLDLYGNQTYAPGQLDCVLLADTALDPTLTVDNAINNQTAFAWSSFHVNVSMNVNFTLSMPVVNTPTDWASIITSQPVFTSGHWVGQLDFHGGTPVAIGGTFDFGYKATFSGGLSYTFTQELIPTPEPGTAGLLALGGVLFGGLAVRRRSKAQ